MPRQRLDNIELSDIQAINDLEALAATNYAGSLRIAKLYALLAVAFQIQIRLSQTVPNTNITNNTNSEASRSRTNRLATKMIDIHIAAIKKRILLVESINERKSKTARRDKALAEFAIAVSSAINDRIPKKEISIAATPAPIRAAIATPIIAELNAPSIDQSYADTIASIEALEASRTNSDSQTVPDTQSASSNTVEGIVEVRELSPELKVIDTGDKLGSAGDWLK